MIRRGKVTRGRLDIWARIDLGARELGRWVCGCVCVCLSVGGGGGGVISKWAGVVVS